MDRQDDRFLDTRFLDGFSKIAVIEEVARKLDTRLFGNGQPGVIDETSKRLEEIEKRENRRMGFVAAIVLAIELSHNAGGILKLLHLIG